MYDIELYSLKTRKQSIKKYYTYKNNPTKNMFNINPNGKKSISIHTDKLSLFLETWYTDNNNYFEQLHYSMDREITFIDADFNRDIVITGDKQGYLMIQRIHIKKINFPKQQIFNNNEMLISSSIYDKYLCVSNVEGKVILIDLDNYEKIKIENNTFKHNNIITTLKSFSINEDVYVIISACNIK